MCTKLTLLREDSFLQKNEHDKQAIGQPVYK